MSVRVAVLADTHAPRRWKRCPARVAEVLRGVELILHAGDVCTAAVLDELAGYAPVHAVMGNNDGPDVAAWGAAPTLEFDIEGLPVAMIHDSGSAVGRIARMHRRFPGAALVVFGHSHIPLDDASDGLRIFNPGSPTDRRRQPHGTMGLLSVTAGALTEAAIIEVTLRVSPAVAMYHVVERLAVGFTDDAQRPSGRVAKRDQVRAESILGESEQITS